MSITETKLFKNRVESPELVTNNISSSHLQAESAIINGIEITPDLFDGQEITFQDVIDVKEQLRSKGLSISSIQPEQVVGFTMKIYGRFPNGVDQLEYITLNRKDTTGDAEALSAPVFMYIKCLGVDGSVIDTIFSNDAVQQVSGDFNATTWRFSNFVLKEEYDTLEIRFSTVQGQQQTNVRVRSTNLQQSGKKLYIQGWDSIYPSNSGVDKRNYTTDFTVGILTKIPNIQAHARNTDIHLDYQKKEKIDSIDTLSEQVSAFTKSITEKMTACEERVEEGAENLLAHEKDTNLHLTDEQKSLIANTSAVLNAHKNNEKLHLNQILKNQITNSISNVNLLSSRIANINTVLNVRENFFTTMREGLVATEAGKTYAHGIQLTKKHFISGTVKSIEIPYKSGENAEFYLAVQIFYENETQSTTKTLNQTFFSQESQKQPGGDGVCAFTFKNLTIPQKYKFIRLIFAQNKESVPNLSTLSNCVKGRVRVLSLEDNNGDYTSFDDDECKLLPSGNFVAYINATTVASVLDQVANRYVPGSNIEINDLLISVPTTDVLDQSTIIPTSNAVYTALETTAQEIRDEIANIEISDDLIKDELPNTNGGLGEKVKDYSILGTANSFGCQGIAYAQICAEDVITEVSYLKRIVVPQHPNATDYTNTNVYLVIYGDTTGSDNWVFVGHSNSTALQQVGGEDMVFEFDNDDHNINLGDYKKYRFFYVQDVTTTPQMPSGFGNSYRGVKMAFPSRNVNTNCLVQQAGGGTAPNHAYPAIITYDTVIPGKILHKDNEDRHVDLELKTSIAEHIDNSDIHFTQETMNVITEQIQDYVQGISGALDDISNLQTSLNSHIGDASHLTNAQKSAISQISTISSDLDSHKTNEDIHFSKSEIMDNVAGSLETWDMSLGASVKGAQGIAYAQICNNHVLQEGSYLTKIVVPQHTSPQASEVTTGVDLYLVIFGDNENSASSDETKWQFVTCSTNEGQQQIGGNSSTKPDLVFEFEKGVDLGLYRRYRFFYVTDRTVTPTLPTVFGTGYTGVKMAFPSRGIDADCKVRMTGGGWATSHTFPAIIHFIKDSAELRSINHKDNDEKHLTVGFRDTVSSAISKISEIEDKINDINFVLGVEKQEYTTFSSELPVPTDITNQETTQILLASSRCVSGKIKKIEIPYTKGKGTTGYLAVQIIHSGESANIEKTLEDTYFSTETQTQTNNQSGVSTFHFDNLFIPSDFYAIRFSFVSNRNTVPDYGGSNCLRYAIRMVSITESDYSNPVHNHDGYKIFNPANQGYSYSNTSYGVIVSVESVKSSFDFITGELYRLKKVIS